MASGQAVATWATYRNLSLGVAGQSIKATPGEVGGYIITNNAASVRYLKFYDTAATPDQTYTPKLTIAIPATSVINLLAPAGIDFTTGIAARASTGIADNDTGAPTANDVVVNILYR